jgi:hypothetical protein
MSNIIAPKLLERTMDYINALDIDRRRKLAEFVGVQPQTVRQWLRGKSVPLGKRALQLHYILEWAGYGDHEWPTTNDSIETIGRALTFELITDEELVEAFKHEKLEARRIIQMLGGNKYVSPSCQKVFDDMAAVYSWNIKESQEKWDHLRIANEKDKLISELAIKLKNLLPLVKDMASDKWSEKDRYELRERAGVETIFKLYNSMGLLAGERHRKSTMAERAQKAATAMYIKKNEQ